MPVELILAALVLAVVILVAADFFRTTEDSPHEHAGASAPHAGRGPPPAPRAVATPFLPPPGRAGGAGHAFDAGRPGPPRRTSSPADGRQHPDAGTAIPRSASHASQKNWLVRTRLSLLAVVSALAAALVTVGATRAADTFQRASFHSNVSSIRDGAAVSAVAACIVSVAVLAVGVASAIILIWSVLRPLRTLQAGAVQ